MFIIITSLKTVEGNIEFMEAGLSLFNPLFLFPDGKSNDKGL
jgi:hypothetical protein